LPAPHSRINIERGAIDDTVFQIGHSLKFSSIRNGQPSSPLQILVWVFFVLSSTKWWLRRLKNTFRIVVHHYSIQYKKMWSNHARHRMCSSSYKTENKKGERGSASKGYYHPDQTPCAL